MTTEKITRGTLMNAVELALEGSPLPEGDRKAIRDYAERVPRVAAGTWNVPGEKCSCPASGAGLDRLRIEVRGFAGLFDMYMEVDPDDGPAIFEIID